MSRYSHALVVGKFAPLHLGHQQLLEHARALADELTVIVWSNPDFPEMSNEVRAGWVRSLYPTACVLVGDDGPRNEEPDGVQRNYTAALLARHGRVPDVVITREQYGPGLAAHLGIVHEWAGALRSEGEPSGSLIRADVHSHRHLLDPSVYSHFVDRVVLMGAESTGKSTLCERLASEFGTEHVQEYGREHYAARGGQLDLDDYVTIARVHRANERTSPPAGRIDTCSSTRTQSPRCSSAITTTGAVCRSCVISPTNAPPATATSSSATTTSRSNRTGGGTTRCGAVACRAWCFTTSQRGASPTTSCTERSTSGWIRFVESLRERR